MTNLCEYVDIAIAFRFSMFFYNLTINRRTKRERGCVENYYFVKILLLRYVMCVTNMNRLSHVISTKKYLKLTHIFIFLFDPSNKNKLCMYCSICRWTSPLACTVQAAWILMLSHIWPPRSSIWPDTISLTRLRWLQLFSIVN